MHTMRNQSSRRLAFTLLGILSLPYSMVLLQAQGTTTSIAATTTSTSAPPTTTVPASISRRYFPNFVNGSSQTTGLAVVNLSGSAANLTFRAYSDTGSLLTSSQRSLAARAQLVGLVGQILPALGNTTGWLVMESNVAGVEGFFLLFDFDLTVMDGSTVSGNVLTDFVLPAADDGELNLVNPSNSPVNCSVEYVSESGSAATATPLRIPGMGRVTAQLSALRPAGARGGYLRGRSDGIVPLAVIGKPGWRAVLDVFDLSTVQAAAAQEAGEAVSPKTLYAPQYAVGGGVFSTVMDLLNLESSATALTLKLFVDNGAQIGTTGSVVVPARGSVRITDPAIFGISAGAGLVQGYVQVQSADGRFAGWVRFTDPAEQSFGSALQFVSAGLSTTYFSQVAQNDVFFTGLAALNPNLQTATATITAYNTNGVAIATGTQQIPPGGRFSKTLPELVGTLPPLSDGYFALTANVPVAGFALFGTHSSGVLSAIPPQSPVGSSTLPTTTTTTSSSSTTTTTSSTTSSSSSTTTSSTTTTTAQSGPPFNPQLTLTIEPLSAGTTPDLAVGYAQEAGELNVRSLEMQIEVGRANISKLSVGQVIGNTTLNIVGIGAVSVEHVVVSKTDTGVTTVFRTPFLGLLFPVADGQYDNVGADGVRMLLTIRNPIPFADTSQTGSVFAFKLPVGAVYVLPSQAGKTFTVTTTITSVLPTSDAAAKAKSVVRRLSFTTTP